jgi:hypothetical protein
MHFFEFDDLTLTELADRVMVQLEPELAVPMIKIFQEARAYENEHKVKTS